MAARDDERLFAFVERLNNAANVTERWKLLNDEIAKYGFGGATYGLSSGLRSGTISEEVIYYSSYRRDFLASYVQEGFADHDYAVLHCAKPRAPALWSEIKQVYPTSRSVEFVQMADDFGLREGIVIPFCSPHDRKTGGIGLSILPGEEAELAVRLRRDWPYTLAFCTAFDEAMRAPYSLRETYRLSAREIECLTLTCLGRLNKEIAAILRLSDKTVEHYLNHAVGKLRARNKHHAAAKAAILGLLTP